MTRPRKLVIALLWWSAIAQAHAQAPDPKAVPSGVTDLVESHWDAFLELNPGYATFIGDYRFNDRLAIGISPTHRARALALEERSLASARELDRQPLDPKDRLTLELFIRARSTAITAFQFPDHLMPVDHLQSLPVALALFGGGASVQPFTTVTDYDNWLARLESWPLWVEQAIVNMRQGAAAGIVTPWPVVQRSLLVLREHVVDDVRQSVFWGPVERMPASFPSDERQRLTQAFSRSIRELVVPGYSRLVRFLEHEYAPHMRQTVALTEQPDGEAWYRFLIRLHTTTDLTATRIHRLGRQEVSRLSGEIRRLERRQAKSPSAPTSPVLLLDGYRALRKIVEPRLGEIFSQIPAAELEIRPVEAFRRGTAPGAFYMAGLPDGTRPGRFYVNASEETAGIPSDALFLHEALPGHHFQISLQREIPHLPRFRRFSNITAFVEGWALYSESLGRELGLYRTDDQRLRALRSEMFRARRLVVDTGIHSLGWSRSRAIEYLGSDREVDRYIAWPGQALAYTIGQLRITSLRRQAEDRLGRRFDLRSFHQAVLAEGSVPLDLLEERILAWIQSEFEEVSVRPELSGGDR